MLTPQFLLCTITASASMLDGECLTASLSGSCPFIPGPRGFYSRPAFPARACLLGIYRMHPYVDKISASIRYLVFLDCYTSMCTERCLESSSSPVVDTHLCSLLESLSAICSQALVQPAP